jgi:hypothetical protein
VPTPGVHLASDPSAPNAATLLAVMLAALLGAFRPTLVREPTLGLALQVGYSAVPLL